MSRRSKSPTSKSSRRIQDERKNNAALWRDTFRKADKYETKKSIRYTFSKIPSDTNTDVSDTVTIKVFHEDIYTLLDAMHTEGFVDPYPMLVNPGNNNEPISSVKQGAPGHEMDLLRRSNYHLALDDVTYPLHDDEVLYSPQVVIFKNADGRSKPNPVTVSVCNIPPLIRPSVMSVPSVSGRGYTEKYSVDSDATRARDRINAMFRVAQAHGHDTIVIPNYGGGTYQNPIVDTIEFFNDAIKKYPIKYVFFAIRTHDDITKDKEFLAYHSQIKRVQ